MSPSWDPPKFPERGDSDHSVLLESVGRALTSWEDLESFLAHLYAGLSEKSLYDQTAIYEYGALPNVPSRVEALRLAGNAYFIKYPHQTLEAELCWVANNFLGWSQRRNDVAHGVVRLIDMAKDRRKTFLSSANEWALVPPHFKEKKHFEPNIPARILTSIEINRFAHAFWEITHRVFALSKAVELPRFALPITLGPPPSLN